MRILHTADWHLGRSLYGQSLISDQKYVLNQVIDIASRADLDAVIIAGDIFDRTVPPVNAIELFDQVLTYLIDELELSVFFIAGNHDSPKRLGYGSALLAQSRCHVVGQLNLQQSGVIAFHDRYGPVEIALLPYAEHGAISQYAKRLGQHKSVAAASENDETQESNEVNQKGQSETHKMSLGRNRSHKQSLEWLISRAANQCQSQRRILVAHAHVEGGVFGDSERLLPNFADDQVSLACLESFQYTALGHLHKAQWLTPTVHYPGSLLQYSFAEVADQKSVTIIDLDQRGAVHSEQIPLRPQYPLHCVSGHFAEILKLGEVLSGQSSESILDHRDLVRDCKKSAVEFRKVPESERMHEADKDCEDVDRVECVETRSTRKSTESQVEEEIHKSNLHSKLNSDSVDASRAVQQKTSQKTSLIDSLVVGSTSEQNRAPQSVAVIKDEDCELARLYESVKISNTGSNSAEVFACQDYLRITLLDQGPILEAANRLRRFFPKLLHLRRRPVKKSARRLVDAKAVKGVDIASKVLCPLRSETKLPGNVNGPQRQLSEESEQPKSAADALPNSTVSMLQMPDVTSLFAQFFSEVMKQELNADQRAVIKETVDSILNTELVDPQENLAPESQSQQQNSHLNLPKTPQLDSKVQRQTANVSGGKNLRSRSKTSPRNNLPQSAKTGSERTHE